MRAGYGDTYSASFAFIQSVFLCSLIFNLPYSKCLRRRSLFHIKPLTATAHMNYYFPSKSELKKRKKCNKYTMGLVVLTVTTIVMAFAYEYDRAIVGTDKSYVMHSTMSFVLAFVSSFWVHSYFFIIPKDDSLKKWCTSMDVRVLEADATI